MNERLLRYSVTLSVALVAGMFTPAALAKEKFALASAVPDDVFLCVADRNNPERVFLDEYWSEVINAFKQTGVTSDVMGLIGAQLGEAELAEIDRFKELATRLLEGVDWKALGGGEFVFAERMTGPTPIGDGDFTMFPDMVWMFRGTEGSASRNYEGLVSILQSVTDEINKASGEAAMAVDVSMRGDTKVAGLNLLAKVPQAPPFSLSVALRRDTIVMALGKEMLGDVLDLMDGKGSKKPLAASPRFKKAFAKLPAPEDEMTFFDMQAMLVPFRALADTAIKEAMSSAKDEVTNAYFNEEANELAAQGVKAYEQGDYAKALAMTKKAHAVAPTDSRIMYNLACFHALVGDKDLALDWLGKAVDGGFNKPGQIAKDSDLKTLRDEPQYKKALALAKATQEAKGPSNAEAWVSVVERLFNVPGMLDYTASVAYTEGYSTHTEEVAVLVPGASKNPLYGVFGKRKPMAAFDRYLPEETVSFSVCSGVDLDTLYGFIEDTIRSFGPKGEEILGQWAGIQEQIGLNVRKDIFGWIEGSSIKITLEQPMGNGTVFMLGVSNEDMAREKIAAGLDSLSNALQQAAQQNPMLAMMAVRTTPLTHEKLSGFHNIMVGMQPQPIVCGVVEGHLVLASSADAVATCLATAAGEHPNIRKNSRFMAEGVIPSGSAQSVSFTDKRALGAKLAQASSIMATVGGMAAMAVPDPQAQQMLAKVLGIVSKLSPVAQKIDFYKSSADYVTFDGKAWYTRSVTNYQSPGERTARSD